MKLSILTLLLVCLAARLASTQCSSECDYCVGSTCYSCLIGYALYDGYCYSCSSGCNTCTYSGSTQQCTECSESYGLYNGYCYSCSSGCNSCYYESSTQQCTECSDSYGLYDGSCYSCDYPCTTCTYEFGYDQECTGCYDGYDLSDGECVYDCYDCDYDWWGYNWWIVPVVVFVLCFIIAIVRGCMRRSPVQKPQMTAVERVNVTTYQAPIVPPQSQPQVQAQAQAWNQYNQQPPMQNWNQAQQPQWGWNQPGTQQQQQAYYPPTNY